MTLHQSTNTEDLLRYLVAARLKIDPAGVPMDVPIVAELGLDSIDVIQFLLEIEQRFPAFHFADPSVSELQTLRDLALSLDNVAVAKKCS